MEAPILCISAKSSSYRQNVHQHENEQIYKHVQNVTQIDSIVVEWFIKHKIDICIVYILKAGIYLHMCTLYSVQYTYNRAR